MIAVEPSGPCSTPPKLGPAAPLWAVLFLTKSVMAGKKVASFVSCSARIQYVPYYAVISHTTTPRSGSHMFFHGAHGL